MKKRKHHNNKGYRQIKRGKTIELIKRLCRKYKIPMKTLLILLCLFFSGCNPAEYRGEIKVYDANDVLVRRVEARTNKAALIKDGDVELDGRGSGFGDFIKGILQFLTLGIFLKD